MSRHVVSVPDGWLFLIGYGLITLGYVVCGLIASVVHPAFLGLVIGYFVLAGGVTVVKIVGLRRLEMAQLTFLVFEVLTVLGFTILLATTG